MNPELKLSERGPYPGNFGRVRVGGQPQEGLDKLSREGSRELAVEPFTYRQSLEPGEVELGKRCQELQDLELIPPGEKRGTEETSGTSGQHVTLPAPHGKKTARRRRVPRNLDAKLVEHGPPRPPSRRGRGVRD